MLLYKHLKLFGFLALLTFSTAEAVSMPIGKKLYLMSEISGTITLNGEPAAGAKLKRIVSKAYSRSELTDETVTDANGYFTMPAVTQRKFIQKIFPMEFVVPSEIYVTYQGKEYFIWTSTKREPEKNIENRGNPLIVQCELTNEERGFRVNRMPITTICTWDVEVDPPRIYGGPIPDDEI